MDGKTGVDKELKDRRRVQGFQGPRIQVNGIMIKNNDY
jgi:hypothetical protein